MSDSIDKPLKLYSWQPKGHGEYSLFVCAEDEASARAAVDRYIAEHLDMEDDEWLCASCVAGWGTDYYQLTVVEAGQVITNAND